MSSLDRRLREDMQLELTRLHREVGVTIVNVTHDQHEALFVSDRVALMNEGRVVQVGHGRELYETPASTFVAAFLGDPYLLRGQVRRAADRTVFEADGLALAAPAGMTEGAARLVLRPERLRLLPAGAAVSAWDNALRGRVVFAAFDGTGVFVQVRLEVGFTVSVHTTMRDNLDVEVGEEVVVAWNAEDAALVPIDERASE